MLARIRQRLPTWGRVRPVLRSLSLPRSFGGWIILVVDCAQRVQFTKNLAGRRVLDLLHQWGWLAGILWLGCVVLWAAARPNELDRVHAQHRLKEAIVQAALKLDSLLSPSTFSFTQKEAPAFYQAAQDFRSALHALTIAAIDSAPADRRAEYTALYCSMPRLQASSGTARAQGKKFGTCSKYSTKEPTRRPRLQAPPEPASAPKCPGMYPGT